MPELDLEERVLLASIQARVLRAPLEPVRLGTFELVRKIGTGGMGVVYVARDVRKDGLVALKTLPRPSPRGIAQLKEEFRIAADLTHPNLIVLYELAFDADRPYFTMELVDGTDAVSALRSALSAEDGRAAARPFHDLVTQLFSALGFLQARARIHRDLKPGNVMVTSAGRVVVLDFGLTREIATTTRASSRGPWGTPGYMSPEQTRGERLTAKSDCYAAGVLLAESCAADHATARAAIQRGPAAIAELAGAARALVPEFPALLAGLLEEDVAHRLDAEAALELLLQSQRRLLSPAPELVPVFVGRRRELALLDQALAAAREQARVVLVSGGAGLGKTALVRAFLERVPDGVTSLSGRCFESDSVPYKALDTLVESLAKHLSALEAAEAASYAPRYLGALVRLFPQLLAVPSFRSEAVTTPSTDERENRRQAFRALQDILGKLASARPLVLFIDDFQWGDWDSVAALDEILRPPDAPHALVVVGLRRDPRGDAGVIGGLRNVVRTNLEVPELELELAPLSAAESAELARGLLRDSSAAEHERLTLAARGSPFLLLELARHLEVTAWSGLPDPSGGELLESMIAARRLELPDSDQRLLELLAVARGPVARSIAVAAARLDASADATLHRLRAGRWIRSDSSDHELVEIYHDQIAEALIAGLSPERIALRHGDLGRALETSKQRDFERLVWHFERAGDQHHASRYAAHAADQALRSGAFENAIRYYRLALVAPEAARDGELRRRLADALRLGGRSGEAADAYLEAARSAPAEAVRELRRSAALQFLHSGQFSKFHELLPEFSPELKLRIPATPRAALAELLWHRARLFVRGLGYDERRREISKRQLEQIDAYWTIAQGFVNTDMIRGACILSKGLLLAMDSGEPMRMARALAMEAAAVGTAGPAQAARAEELLKLARSLAGRSGDVYARAVVALMAASIRVYCGDFAAGEHDAEAAEATLRSACEGVAWELCYCHVSLLNAKLALGHWRELRQLTLVAMAEAVQRGNPYYSATLRNYSYIVKLIDDDPIGAEADVEEGFRAWQAGEEFHIQHLPAFHGSARCLLYQGRYREAHHRLEAMWPKIKRSLILRVQLARTDFLTWRLRAALGAYAETREPGCERVVRRMFRKLEGERYPGVEPTLVALRALWQSLHGESPEAGLRFAIAGYEALSMRLLAAATRCRLAAELGGPEAEALRREGERTLRAESIRSPESVTRMLLPPR